MGLEGLFGGEKHTKETYQDASRDLVEKERLKRHVYNSPDVATLYSVISRNAEKARSKIEKLYGKGKDEAMALNEEYDRLLVQAKEAAEAVEHFEKDKLGMSEETVH